jgi:hypothetical protein
MPVMDGRASQRWPAFGPEATSAGVGALFTFPVRLGAISFGTLDLHRQTAGELNDDQLACALSTVDAAAGLLLALTAGELDGVTPDLTYRMIVHQAAGMAMMQLDSTIEEALLRLRATAYAEGITINDLSADLVSRRRRLSKDQT